MTTSSDVTCRPLRERTLWLFVGLGAAGAALAAVRVAYRGDLLDAWAAVGLLLALAGVASLHQVTARVSADAYGVHCRTLLRRRSVPWADIADVRVHLGHTDGSRTREARRVGLALRDGHSRLLPLPKSWAPDDPDFRAELDALRTLHRRHGAPESSDIRVVSHRTAGSGWAGSLCLCGLLLAGAGVAAWRVPDTASYAAAWRTAPACTAETPAGLRDDCLTTVPAVIARTEAHLPEQRSRLYFTDSRPLARLDVSSQAARDFRSGDHVELTVWHGRVMQVAGEGHVWREHITTPGSPAVVAAVLALAAGGPGARVLLRLRGRDLPDDEVLPSALPFAGALAGTALWLLPLCYFHPTTPLSEPASIAWAAAGSLLTLGMLARAWRATRVRAPEDAGGTEPPEEGEVFLPARFLEPTDYNPLGFGTHIVIGDGPPAVTPGPGRFGARRIPVGRLTVRTVRRARGGDGDTVPRSWHIAELDDAGHPIRLAAAPADLNRIIRELDSARAARSPGRPAEPRRTTPARHPREPSIRNREARPASGS
ncbi:PH domain-containing protein [Streptomyces sp. NPDC007905]|uniref:PH domain-containing protein n=1 Tax=Streptomyces sp. NPDC007905 TaxID=3364788 RepID=UPI0036E5F6BB